MLASEDEVVDRFGTVIDAVRERAPRARILLVVYLTILGRDAKLGPDIPFTEEQFEHHQQMGMVLKRAYARAAEAKEGVKVVPIAELSDGHGVGSEEPWVTTHGWALLYGGMMSWHPNKRGMEAVAEIMFERLKGATRAKL